MNCCVDPAVKLADEGETAMEVTVFAGAEGTVIAAVPLTPPSEAVTVVEPAATPVARPAEFTVAMDGAALIQVAVEVTSFVELSL